jgi:hypothetical protein
MDEFRKPCNSDFYAFAVELIMIACFYVNIHRMLVVRFPHEHFPLTE